MENQNGKIKLLFEVSISPHTQSEGATISKPQHLCRSSLATSHIERNLKAERTQAGIHFKRFIQFFPIRLYRIINCAYNNVVSRSQKNKLHFQKNRQSCLPLLYEQDVHNFHSKELINVIKLN